MREVVLVVAPFILAGLAMLGLSGAVAVTGMDWSGMSAVLAVLGVLAAAAAGCWFLAFWRKPDRQMQTYTFLLFVFVQALCVKWEPNTFGRSLMVLLTVAVCILQVQRLRNRHR